MTECNINLETLVRAVATMLRDWRVITSEIHHVVTLRHLALQTEIRFRFVTDGKNEGQLKVFGRLCGELIKYNPVLNDIFENGDTKITAYMNPQQTPEAIARNVKRRVVDPLLEIVTQAEELQRKAADASLRRLMDQEEMISASRNQLMRTPEKDTQKMSDRELKFYDRKTGRSVEATITDPQATKRNVTLTITVDTNEACAILATMFDENWRDK